MPTITPEIIELLTIDARAWWYNRQLREQNRTSEAEKREQQQIDSHLESIKEAWLLTIGRGGYALYCGEHKKVSGYDNKLDAPHTEFLHACLLAGIPTIDSTTISDDDIYDVIRFPMPAKDAQHKDAYHSLDYAPAAEIAQMYKELGATLYNF